MTKFLLKSIMTCFFMASAMAPAFADGTINVADGTGDGTGWSYSNNSIVIEAAGSYTLTGTTETNSIIVNSALTVNITLDDVSISTVSPFYITPNTAAANTIVNLTLINSNVLTATKNGTAEGGFAGLGVPLHSTVNINGTGSLIATGSKDNSNSGGAGIGSQKNKSSGKININSGFITAISQDKAAGIGSGYHGTQGAVAIEGGVVIVENKGSGNSIGHYNGTGGSFTIGGNAVVIVKSSIHDPVVTSVRRKSGLLLEDTKCTFYSESVAITNDFTFPANNTITIPEGKSLSIPEGVKMTSNGTVNVEGTFTIDGELINNGTVQIDGVAVNNGNTENFGAITIYGSYVNNGTIRNRNDGVINGIISGNPLTVELYTIDIGTVTENGPGYTFENGLVTLIEADAFYTVTGVSSTNRIAVAPSITVNVIFSGLNITSSETPLTAGSSSKVNLTLNGANVLTATGSEAGFGISQGTSVIIDGQGSLNATGNSNAGIGGEGNITVKNGTITASSTSSFGINANIAVNGGVVTAIGGEGKASTNGAFTMDGNGVVIVESIGDASAKKQGLLINGNAGTIYGTGVSPTLSWTLPEGKTFTLDGARTFTVATGKTFTNNGTIEVYGDLNVNGTLVNNGTIRKCGTITGDINGNQPVDTQREQIAIDLATVNASGEGYIYTYSKLTLTKNNAEYTLTGKTTSKSVEVAAGLSVKVNLNNVDIQASKALFINPSSVADITITGINTLISKTQGSAGIGVPAGAKVIINGTGSLRAEGNGGSSVGGAGIGGTANISAGIIIINGGEITAIGNKKAAGIGGGYHSGYEEIQINGGFVSATGIFWASSKGDGIGGYGSDAQVPAGPFKMNGTGVVMSTNVRDKSPKQKGLLFDLGRGYLYGTEAEINRDITMPYGSQLTVKAGQTLIVPEGVTLNWGASTELSFEQGSTFINNGTLNGYERGKQLSIDTEKANVSGSGSINLTEIPYDNRDRLYFRFHILANCLFDGTKTTTMTESEILGWENKVVEFESLLEKHSPNVNVVTETVSHKEQTTGTGTGNSNSFGAFSVNESSLKSKCMDVFVARPTGSPSYAAYYAGEYIHMTVGSGAAAMMHEYAHHVQSLLTNYNPDDGQSWEALYYRYDTMATNFYWEGLIKDQGELWDGDDEWLYADTNEQLWPDEVIFPDYGTVATGKALYTSVFTGGSGDGKFVYSNSGLVPPVSSNGWLFKVTFFPNDKSKHNITKDIPLRFAGVKLDPTITLMQFNIREPEIPSPYVLTDPTLPVTIEYKTQGAPSDTYTTTAPSAPGNYSVRASFAGNDDYNAASATMNFTIYGVNAIPNTDAKEQVVITSGKGFIRVDAGVGAAGSVLSVYTVYGSQVASKYITAGQTDIPVERGLYIVNYGSARKKVIVR
ncbi:MAG: carbohydrate-binding domain-containing protein [Dysgonamonadaceae bacterium]|jgi:hypothetical protein|nr:carbohydrate-binding domain-containing protein [Dysgonamonadaceae bacterium]